MFMTIFRHLFIHTHILIVWAILNYHSLISHFKTQTQSLTHRRLATNNSGGRRELGLEPRFHERLKQSQSTEKSRPTGSKPFGGLYLNWMDNSTVVEVKEYEHGWKDIRKKELNLTFLFTHLHLSGDLSS